MENQTFLMGTRINQRKYIYGILFLSCWMISLVNRW